MTIFAVKYFDRYGNTVVSKVEAANAQVAIQVSGIPLQNIVAARIDLFDSIIFWVKKREIPIRKQASIAQNWASMIKVGETPNSIYLKLKKFLGNSIKGNFEGKLTTYEFFVELKLHPVLITLAKAGEATGAISESLKAGATFLKRMEDIKSKSKKNLREGIMYAGMGLGLMFAGPIFIGGQLEGMNSEIPLNLNIASKILLTLRHLQVDYWFFVIPTLILVIFVIVKNIHKFNGVPILKNIKSIRNYERAILLANMIQLLYRRGYTPEKIIKEMLDTASENDRHHLSGILRTLNIRKCSLSEALPEDCYPDILLVCLSNLETIKDQEEFEENLNTAITSIEENIETESDELGSIAKQLGLILTVLVFLTIAIGFYAPYLSQTSALR